MSAPILLEALTYFAVLNGNNRLLYNETAAKTITELTRPAYRLAVAEGRWVATGRLASEMQLQMVKDVGILAEVSKKGDALPSDKIPALSKEEEMCAHLFLDLMDYAAGRTLDIGRAVMLTHMHRATTRGSKK